MRPNAGLTVLGLCFALGALIAGVAGVSLLAPDGVLEPIWRFNPEAHASLGTLGGWAVVLLLTVAAACMLSAVGLWIGARWGQRLAVGVLAVNLAGNITSAVTRSDPRTLIGLPIAGALIIYLLSPGVRSRFR